MRAVHVTRDGDSYHCEETGEDWTEPPMFTIVPPEPFEDWPETNVVAVRFRLSARFNPTRKVGQHAPTMIPTSKRAESIARHPSSSTAKRLTGRADLMGYDRTGQFQIVPLFDGETAPDDDSELPTARD